MSKEELTQVVQEVAHIVLSTPTVYPEGGGVNKPLMGLLYHNLEEYITSKLKEQADKWKEDEFNYPVQKGIS